MKPLIILLFSVLVSTCVAGLLLVTPIKQGVTVFTPSQLTNLTLWYDLQDATKVTTSGGKVTDLTDKSSAGNNATQATDLLRPTYNATGINGYPSMNGPTGGGSLISLNTTSTVMRVPSSIFVVMKKNGDGNGGIIANPAGSYGAIFPVISYVYSLDVPMTGEIHSTTGLTDLTGAIVEIDYATTNGGSAVYLNNTLLTLSTNTAWPSGVAAGYTSILGGQATGRNYKGDVGEIIICDTVTSQQRTNLYTYLKAKWGTP